MSMDANGAPKNAADYHEPSKQDLEKTQPIPKEMVSGSDDDGEEQGENKLGVKEIVAVQSMKFLWCGWKRKK